jgi:hypothetical protein
LSDLRDLSQLLARAHSFERSAHAILGRHEAARSRVVILEQSYDRITRLSLKHDDLLRQALRCAEHELYRAAHVMAFAGLMDFLFEKLNGDSLTALRRERPDWRGRDIYEMAEYYANRQFIEVTRAVGLTTKNQVKQLTSLLDRRNECAHPSAYYPDLNMTLGYVSEVMRAIADLQKGTVL